MHLQNNTLSRTRILCCCCFYCLLQVCLHTRIHFIHFVVLGLVLGRGGFLTQAVIQEFSHFFLVSFCYGLLWIPLLLLSHNTACLYPKSYCTLYSWLLLCCFSLLNATLCEFLASKEMNWSRVVTALLRILLHFFLLVSIYPVYMLKVVEV